MAVPNFRIGRVTPPALFALRLASYTCMLWPCGHRRRFAAYRPQKGEESNDANSDKEKPQVFFIHKIERAAVSLAGYCLDGESNKADIGCQERPKQKAKGKRRNFKARGKKT